MFYLGWGDGRYRNPQFFRGDRIRICFGVSTAAFFLHGMLGVAFPFFVSPGVAFKGFLVRDIMSLMDCPREMATFRREET